MDRDKFISAMEKASDVVSDDSMDRYLMEVLDPDPLYINTPGTRNLVIVMEELAELQQQISKYLRGKGDMVGLTEELGDVYLSLRYVEFICGVNKSDIRKAMNVKIDRLQKTTGVYI